jgi:hypothetical protein
MAEQHLLIDVDYLKSRRREIKANVSDEVFQTAIRIAQDIDVYPILGSGLFNELVGQQENDNLSALNTTLVDDYVAPALAEYAFVRGLLGNHFKITQKGVQTRHSDFSEAPEMSVLKQLIADAQNVANQYGERLINYLKDNYSSYPLYSNPGTGQSAQYPKNSAINSAGGIWLGDSCGCDDPLTIN